MQETFGVNSTEDIFGEPVNPTVMHVPQPESRPFVPECMSCALFGVVTRMGDNVYRICPQHWASLFYNKLRKNRETKTHHAD